MTLTKAAMVETLARKGYSRGATERILESILEKIKETLESGEDVLISGFGKFSIKGKKERRGRNPATGNQLILGPRRVVTFKCSSVLKDRINRSS